MPPKTKSDRLRERQLAERGFDVTCVIGRVAIDPAGDGEPPHVVAHKLIAEHDAEGSYRFPMPDGRVCRVDVEFELSDADNRD